MKGRIGQRSVTTLHIKEEWNNGKRLAHLLGKYKRYKKAHQSSVWQEAHKSNDSNVKVENNQYIFHDGNT